MWYYLLAAFYLSLVTAVFFYAFRYGEYPEKAGAVIIAAASVLTFVSSATPGNHYNALETEIFVVDIATWVALLRLALTSNRYWPLWATAFHSIALVIHVAVLIDRSIVPQAYAAGQGFWAYPVLVALLLGSERSRRARERMASAMRS